MKIIENYKVKDALGYLFSLDLEFFEKNAKGVSDEEIENLEKIADRKFPEDYKYFLKVLGNTKKNKLGEFLKGTEFNIKFIEQSYRNIEEEMKVWFDLSQYKLPDNVYILFEVESHQTVYTVGKGDDLKLGYLDGNDIIKYDYEDTFQSYLMDRSLYFHQNQFDYKYKLFFQSPFEDILKNLQSYKSTKLYKFKNKDYGKCIFENRDFQLNVYTDGTGSIYTNNKDLKRYFNDLKYKDLLSTKEWVGKKDFLQF